MFAIEYVAGIVDGEGHIGCYQSGPRKYNHLYPRIGVTNTDLSLLEQLQQQFGGTINPKSYGKKGKPENWNQGYDWRCSGDTARNLIKELIPYLWVKKKQAIDTLFADMKLN